MQLEKVTVSFKRKKNLGDYESADASCMLTAFVELEDDKADVMRALWDMAKANVKAALAPYFVNVTVDEMMLGLGIDETPHKEIDNAD